MIKLELLGFYLSHFLSSKMLIICKLETAVTEEMQSLLLRRSTFHIQHSPGLLLLSTKVKGDIEYGISSLGSGRE